MKVFSSHKYLEFISDTSANCLEFSLVNPRTEFELEFSWVNQMRPNRLRWFRRRFGAIRLRPHWPSLSTRCQYTPMPAHIFFPLMCLLHYFNERLIKSANPGHWIWGHWMLWGGILRWGFGSMEKTCGKLHGSATKRKKDAHIWKGKHTYTQLNIEKIYLEQKTEQKAINWFCKKSFSQVLRKMFP